MGARMIGTAMGKGMQSRGHHAWRDTLKDMRIPDNTAHSATPHFRRKAGYFCWAALLHKAGAMQQPNESFKNIGIAELARKMPRNDRRVRGGNGIYQSDGGVRSRYAFWRHPEIRSRPRIGIPRNPRVHQHQDRDHSLNFAPALKRAKAERRPISFLYKVPAPRVPFPAPTRIVCIHRMARLRRTRCSN